QLFHFGVEGRDRALLQDVGNHQQQPDQAGAEDDQRHLLPALIGDLRVFDREEIDAYHLSSGRRTASPIATASEGACSRRAGVSACRSTVTRESGSTTWTGTSSLWLR